MTHELLRTCSAGWPLTVLLLAGCTTTISQEFTRADNTMVEAAYVATDADFARYKRLSGADMGIFFPPDSAVPEVDLQRIRHAFQEAFRRELDNYEVVSEPAADVMRVEASLIDLRGALYGDVPGLRSEIRDIAKPGTLVFLMEMKDSQTGRVLARAADSSANPVIGHKAARPTAWEEVDDAATHWAALFRNFLDQNLAH